MDIEKLRSQATQVASEHATANAAVADANQAEADLLATVIEAVKPAIRAMCSRIKTSESMVWPDNHQTKTIKGYHETPGLLLDGDAEPSRDYPSADGGHYEGEAALYLLPDGRFVRATYSGSWTRWQGCSSGWEATIEEISLLDVVKVWNVEAIVGVISNALAKQVGTRDKVVAKSQARADKLRAVSTLIGGGK